MDWAAPQANGSQQPLAAPGRSIQSVQRRVAGLVGWMLLEGLFVGFLLFVALGSLNYFGIIPLSRTVPLLAFLPRQGVHQGEMQSLESGGRPAASPAALVPLPTALSTMAQRLVQPAYLPPAAGVTTLSSVGPLHTYGWTRGTTVLTGELVADTSHTAAPPMLQVSVRQQPTAQSASTAMPAIVSPLASESANTIFTHYFRATTPTPGWSCTASGTDSARTTVQCRTRYSTPFGLQTNRIIQSFPSQTLLLSVCLMPPLPEPSTDYCGPYAPQ